MSAASLLGLLVLAVGVPSVALAVRANPRLERPFLALMAFSVCHIKKPFYQEVFYIPYRGVDRGFGVTVPDVLFFGLFVSLLLGRDRRQIVSWPYNTGLWILLAAASCLSLVGSDTWYFGLFSLHKLVRGYALYWVTVNLIRDVKDIRTVISALLASVLFQGILVLFHRYVTRSATSRALGSFPHPNSLAMYIDVILPVVLSLHLSKLFAGAMRHAAAFAIGLGILTVVLTQSRASLVLMGGALAAVTCGSLVRGITAHKLRVAGAGVLACALAGALLAPRIIARFESAPKESAETRVHFNEAATAMASDRAFGVGLNGYSWTLANTQYYWYVYSDKLEDEDLDPDDFRDSKQGQSRLGTAHHIYLLFAAETGWAGMWIFLAFLGRYWLKNVRLLFAARDPCLASVHLGTIVGVATLHLQGLLEWAFRQTQIFYLYCLVTGLVIAAGRIPAATRSARRTSMNPLQGAARCPT